MRARLHLSSTLLLFIVLVAPAVAAPQGLADERVEAVEGALQGEFERQELVGLAAAVVHGETITEFHLGFADRSAEIAVGPDTMFRWASISKPLTAIRAMQLAGGDDLDLDADVRTLVPEFPEKPWPITARQLLGHLGGVVHYTNGEVIPTKREYDVEHPFADVVLALHTFDRSPLVAEPGTKFAYTTHGYILLGAVLQRAEQDCRRCRLHDERVTARAQPCGLEVAEALLFPDLIPRSIEEGDSHDPELAALDAPFTREPNGEDRGTS